VSALSVVFSDPTFVHALIGCGALALGCRLLSIVTREYSWVDRLWSTTFTEKISVRRYPNYADYQRITSRLIP